MRNETLRRRGEDENSSAWTIKLKVDDPDPQRGGAETKSDMTPALNHGATLVPRTS